MFKRIICVLSFFCLLTAEEERVVELETQDSPAPLRLSFVDDGGGFSGSYLEKLRNIICFDFENNGMTRIVDKNDAGFSFDLRIRVKDHKLFVTAAAVEDNEIYEVQSKPLSGFLNEDREKIHLLSDAIHKAFFGFEGIASKKILYTVRDGERTWGFSDVWECGTDGGNPRQVTAGQGYCLTPIYFFEGRSFLFVSYKEGEPKIFAADLKNGRGKRLINLIGNQFMPQISRQKDFIIFISDITGNPDIFIQELRNGVPVGRPRLIYAKKGVSHASPTISPDGSRIAFVSNAGGSPRIYLLSIPERGTSLKDIKPLLISRRNRENTAPCFSPDGTKIAYSAKNGAYRQIWIYDLLTKTEWQLTDTSVNKENPCFAPNSLHIVYNSGDRGGGEIYLIDLKRKKPVKISSGNYDKRFPSF